MQLITLLALGQGIRTRSNEANCLIIITDHKDPSPEKENDCCHREGGSVN